MPIPLPITPADALRRVIRPALELLPSSMGAPEAEVMVLAIMLQESGLNARVQVGGPARGLAQFEQAGGVRGVLTHSATGKLARKLCATRGCPPTERSAYLALANDDVLAAGFARLLLWTDPQPLPELGDEQGAFELYALRTWRPGAYARGTPEERLKLRKKWAGHYAVALDTVTGKGDDDHD